MLYGKEKARQMARSILPSTASKSARDERKSIHRSARRATRMETHRLILIESDSDTEFPDIRGDIRMMVSERREADKVRPLMKWAEAVTRNLPDEDKLPTIKRVLPKNLIGEHAISHLMWIDGFDPNTWRGSYRNRYRSEPNWLDPWPSMIYVAVEAIVEVPGNVAALNAVVRRSVRRRFMGNLSLSMGVSGDMFPASERWGAYDLQDAADLPRWWKTVGYEGWKLGALKNLVVEMFKVGFGDCWVERVFVAKCRRPVFERR